MYDWIISRWAEIDAAVLAIIDFIKKLLAKVDA